MSEVGERWDSTPTSTRPGTARRFDFQAPIANAWELKRAWPRAELIIIVADAGHAATDPALARQIAEATNRVAEERDGENQSPLDPRREFT